MSFLSREYLLKIQSQLNDYRLNIVRNDLHFTIKDANGTKKIIYAGYDLPVLS